MQFSFDWGKENFCGLLFGMSGAPSDAALWGIVSSDVADTYAFYPDYFLRAHAADENVNPSVIMEDDHWSFGIFSFEQRSGNETFTIGGKSLTQWTSEFGGIFANLFFEVGCSSPFTITGIAGGDAMDGFSELGNGGSGAGAFSPLAEAHATMSNGVTFDVAAPKGVLIVRSYRGGGAAAGILRTETPNAGEDHVCGFDQHRPDRSVRYI